MKNLWHNFQELRRQGVLGMNRRNADFVLPYNDRSKYPLVDDKLLTKTLAEKFHVATPKLYGTIEIQRQIWDVEKIIAHHDEFVVKPSRGSGGEGILVITSRTRNGFKKANGVIVSDESLRHHLSMVLGGIYSLGGHPDRALIEYRVCFDPVFEKVTYLGVPDIRLIVFLGVPVMSMVRLPTLLSDGKANLHQGAVGAGINIASGKTVAAVYKNHLIEEHPDTGNSLIDFAIPHWEKLLLLAAKSYEMTGLGYQGVDLVLDRDKGPLLLELNARPGLSIQIASRAGLGNRLEKVRSTPDIEKRSPEERVEFARSVFG